MSTPGKRSPTAHRTPEQIRRHNRTYGAKKAVMEKDKEGHRLRRQAIKDGRVRKGEDKDVHHVKPSVKGGADSKANTRIVSASKNRGHGMSPGGTRAGTGRRGSGRKR